MCEPVCEWLATLTPGQRRPQKLAAACAKRVRELLKSNRSKPSRQVRRAAARHHGAVATTWLPFWGRRTGALAGKC